MHFLSKYFSTKSHSAPRGEEMFTKQFRWLCCWMLMSCVIILTVTQMRVLWSAELGQAGHREHWSDVSICSTSVSVSHDSLGCRTATTHFFVPRHFYFAQIVCFQHKTLLQCLMMKLSSLMKIRENCVTDIKNENFGGTCCIATVNSK